MIVSHCFTHRNTMFYMKIYLFLSYRNEDPPATIQQASKAVKTAPV